MMMNGSTAGTRGSGCYKTIKAAGALSIHKSCRRSQYSQSAVPKVRLQRSTDPSIAHAMKMNTRGLAICTATQKRRELLKKLGHDEVQPIGTSDLQPAPPAVQHPAEESTVSTTCTSASASSDSQIKCSSIADDKIADPICGHVLQKINAPAPAAMQVQGAPDHCTPKAAGESKQCGGDLQIIRKSMFKFVIKLGSVAGGNGAAHPTACCSQ
jgi:hypothetical protein